MIYLFPEVFYSMHDIWFSLVDELKFIKWTARWLFFNLTWGYVHWFERGKGRKREGRKGNINVKDKYPPVASSTCLYKGPNQEPRYVPWLRMNLETFEFMGQCSNQLSHTGQGMGWHFLIEACVWTWGIFPDLTY